MTNSRADGHLGSCLHSHNVWRVIANLLVGGGGPSGLGGLLTEGLRGQVVWVVGRSRCHAQRRVLCY